MDEKAGKREKIKIEEKAKIKEKAGLQQEEEGSDSARSRKSKMKRRPLAWDEAKIEIAKELGLWEKVEAGGWAGLTAEESGRLGGILSKRFPGKAPKEESKRKKKQKPPTA